MLKTTLLLRAKLPYQYLPEANRGPAPVSNPRQSYKDVPGLEGNWSGSLMEP